MFSFAFPENDYEKFTSNDEYFLEPIVTFTNEKGKQEVIGGQQRLTTLMLLLRAFYERGQGMKDQKTIKTREIVARSIWKTDEFDTPNTDELKIDSEVATDNDKDEFLGILRTGKADKTHKIQVFKVCGFFSYLTVKLPGNIHVHKALSPWVICSIFVLVN